MLFGLKLYTQTGMAALGLGTYGAHAFKPKNPTYKDVIFSYYLMLYGFVN